jgi:hypothetical protein
MEDCFYTFEGGERIIHWSGVGSRVWVYKMSREQSVAIFKFPDECCITMDYGLLERGLQKLHFAMSLAFL